MPPSGERQAGIQPPDENLDAVVVSPGPLSSGLSPVLMSTVLMSTVLASHGGDLTATG